MNPEAPVMMRRGSAISDLDCTTAMGTRPSTRPETRFWRLATRVQRPTKRYGRPLSGCRMLDAPSARPPDSPGTRFSKGREGAKALARGGYTVPMHEMGIALEIYRVCREAAQANGGGRIERVRMEIGELAAVEPDLLKFAWEAALTGGPDAGAVLDVSWCTAVQRCAHCGEQKRHSEGSWLRICPDCGSPLEVSGGDQLDVIDVTLVSDDCGRDAPRVEEAG